MRFATAAIVAGAAVATASPQYGYGYAPPAYNTSSIATPPVYSTPTPDTYTTEVVTAYTTYCPEPTHLTYNDVTYTITEATTLTITDCPCTVTKPVYTSVWSTTSCPPTLTPTYVAPPVYTAPPAPPANGTMPKPPASTPYYPSPSSPVAPPTYSGAANKASMGAAGLLAAVGLIAAL